MAHRNPSSHFSFPIPKSYDPNLYIVQIMYFLIIVFYYIQKLRKRKLKNREYKPGNVILKFIRFFMLYPKKSLCNCGYLYKCYIWGWLCYFLYKKLTNNSCIFYIFIRLILLFPFKCFFSNVWNMFIFYIPLLNILFFLLILSDLYVLVW